MWIRRLLRVRHDPAHVFVCLNAFEVHRRLELPAERLPDHAGLWALWVIGKLEQQIDIKAPNERVLVLF